MNAHIADKHILAQAIRSSHGLTIIGILVPIIVMHYFGEKVFVSPLFAFASVVFVLLIVALCFNQKIALYILTAGLIAFEEFELSNSYAYHQQGVSSSILGMRIAGVSAIDAVTLLFLLFVVIRRIADAQEYRTKFWSPSDMFFLPFVLAYGFGMVTGYFQRLTISHFTWELRDVFYIAAFYYITSRTFTHRKDIVVLLSVILGTFALKSLFFIYRYLEGEGLFYGYGYYRVALGSDIPLIALAAIACIVGFILSRGHSILLRVVLFICIAYTSVLLVASIGRSTYILTVVSLVIVFILLRKDIGIRHILATIGMGFFGGFIFYFYVLTPENRELISYAISTAFNWYEAIQLYSDLSMGQRIIEFINIWETLSRNSAWLWGLGWGAPWTELVIHHPFDQGSFSWEEQYSGIHTTAHIDAIYFLHKVGIIGTILIYATHVRFLVASIQSFSTDSSAMLKLVSICLIVMIVMFFPNYTYFVKLKLLLGITFGAIAVFSGSIRKVTVA